MNNQNQTTAAASSHIEIANTAFQVVTIAMVGLFSLLSVLNIAAQIV